ncbi:MAG: hypothetical protein IJ466_01525 [Clostridia bacterium]|nr:hypothetical protein [Clostridia bacterium]
MKKLLAIILVLVLLMGIASGEGLEWNPVPGSPAEADGRPAPGNQLGYILLEELYASGENMVISPYSLALALGMAAEGAEGETLAQLKEILCVEELRELTEAPPEGVSSANAAFVQPGVELKEEYLAALEEYYAAGKFEIDGEVVDKVNAWVEEKTNGLIRDMLSQAPDPLTGMILLNAVSMKADWAKPFFESGTQEEIFHAESGDLAVQMMHQTDRFRYAEKDGVQIICLPYAQSDLEMWIALPAEDGEAGLDMAGLLDVLSGVGSFYLTGDAVDTKVELSMPKFDIADDNSFVELIRELGMSLPFGAEAQFGGISDVPMYIGEIAQKARVKVDEAGTEAAAVTMVAMAMMAAPGMAEEPVAMEINRPFMFAITDAASGSLCFAGVVENPAV